MNLFVYGSLQPGHSQFSAFFDPMQKAEPAWVLGRIEVRAGYPLLTMDPKTIVCEAAYSWDRDTQLFQGIGSAPDEPTGTRVPGFLLPGALTNRNVAELDSYEDIQPPSFGEYRRWLTWCWRPEPSAVWLYAKISD